MAQAQQHIDFVNAGKIPCIRTTVFVQADAKWLVVRPYAVEKTVSIQQLEQHVVYFQDIAQRIFRNYQEIEGNRVRNTKWQDAHQRICGTLEGENRPSVVFKKYPLRLK